MDTMLTITLGDLVSEDMTVAEHKLLLKAALQKLRRLDVVDYVWVREFQGNASPHWHIFCRAENTVNGVDIEKSLDWSSWVTSYCSDLVDWWQFDKQLFFMENGNGKDFLGCCRWEKLRTGACGCYAGKEGAKRFQKEAPAKWSKSGRWWAPSRTLTCTPHQRVQVRTSSLRSTTITTANGRTLDVPFKSQFGRGQSIELPEGSKE